MHRRTQIAIPVVLTAALAGWGAVDWLTSPPRPPDRWDHEAQQRTIERAQPLVEALAAHHADRGRFPDTLEELVPAYLDAIPEPAVGSRAFRYSPDESGYDLLVESSDTDPPPAILMMIFGPYGFDDRSFQYSQKRDEWFMADW